MKKRFIILFLLIAVAAYVWFYEIEGEKKRTAEQEQQDKLFTFSKDSVQKIKINDFETTYQFERENGKWIITNPVNTDADSSVISNFLNALYQAKKSRSFSVKQNDKHKYGLDNPLIKVSVVTANGGIDSVQFGYKTSIGEDMYVAKSYSDSIVFITAENLKKEAQKPLFQWRDKKAMHVNMNEVISFNIKIGNMNYAFQKENSEWRMVKPVKAKADKDNVEAILRKLENGTIKSVEAENISYAGKYNLANPYFKIDISTINGSEKSISFSKLKDNKSFGKDSSRPHVFVVDEKFINAIEKSSFNLRDKDLIDFNVALIDRINLFFKSTVLTFNKDTSNTWQIASGEPIKSDKIKKLVQAVQDLKVDRFVAENPTYLSPFGLAPSKGSLELFKDGSKEVELEFGMEKNDERYIRKKQSKAVYTVKSAKMKNILIKLSDILDKPEETQGTE